MILLQWTRNEVNEVNFQVGKVNQFNVFSIAIAEKFPFCETIFDADLKKK